MPRSVFPRARGGRGPQVGPGTFLGKSDTSSTEPPIFSAIAWCPGPETPSTELWCMHTSFTPIAPSLGVSHYLFLDKVPGALEFSPPPGASPTSVATVTALKEYARNRGYDAGFPSSLDDWTVHVGVPVPSLTTATNKKFADGVYRVAQADRPSQSIPLAWVWVYGNGRREIWLYFEPNSSIGFHFVGTQPDGQLESYDATTLQITRIEPPGSEAWDPVGAYGSSMQSFKLAATNDLYSPASSIDDLAPHDLRVQGWTY